MLFTVFGSPISHSLSPFIHQAFAQQFNLNITYTKTLSLPSEFLSQLTQLKNNHDLIGANITSPLKQLAYSLCQKVSARAELAESVNTIYWDSENQNRLVGDNTDGVGFERDIYINARQSFEDQNILILGAGGAASGILPNILAHHPRAVYILNRTQKRAEVLCDKFKINLFSNLTHDIQFDWVINTAGQFNTIENIISQKEKWMGAKFYDLSYAQFGLTPFLKSIQAFNPFWYSDGLGMLVEQAAEAFYIWHHRKPETTTLLKKMRNDPT
jgi:shikimate dehydrogenase